MASEARRHIRQSRASRVFDVCNHVVLALLGIVTLGPFLYLVAGSLTETNHYLARGVTLNPLHWTLASYRLLLGGASRIYQGLKVSLFITVVGTLLSLTVSAGLAYGLSKKQLPGRTVLLFYVLFTMLFGGGMVPFYLVVHWLKLTDTLWSLILPMLVNAWYMFIMMKFFESLPTELEDAARIDGCSELGILLRIVLPLSRPVLATMSLFYGVGYWNEWFWATIFLSKPELLPLQLVLRQILASIALMTDPRLAAELAKQKAQNPPPAVVLRMAAIIVTVLPIAMVYPFLQKHFVKGVLVGSIKG